MDDGFLFNGPDNAGFTILLAHGAGAPMDSDSMTASAEALAAVGFRVARFEFGYMAERRKHRARWVGALQLLMPEYVRAIERLGATGKLIIGGKSMGGRVASMIADKLYAEGKIAGLVCIGYPFHPPDKPTELRTAHLASLKTPTLIVQGTRDGYGRINEVSTYTLSDRIEIFWLEDGDHDLKPRQKISGFSAADHKAAMANKIRQWADAI